MCHHLMLGEPDSMHHHRPFFWAAVSDSVASSVVVVSKSSVELLPSKASTLAPRLHHHSTWNF